MSSFSGSSSPQLSYGGAVALTAVICSVVFLVVGFVLGMLCCFFTLRHNKQSRAIHRDVPPLPVYEDIQCTCHVLPTSVEDNKQAIDLKENTAYGPI